jgi:hypothetical protein
MKPIRERTRTRALFGTAIRIQLLGSDPDAIMDAAFAEIEAIHYLTRFNAPGSDIARVNRATIGEPVCVDARTAEMIVIARKMSLFSHGLFDITGGNTQRSPVSFTQSPHSYRNVALLPGNRLMRTAPVQVDVGGLATGYAIDRAVRILLWSNVEDALVSANHLHYGLGFKSKAFLNDPLPDNYFPFSGHARNQLISNEIRIIARDAVTADALGIILGLAPELAAQCAACWNAEIVQAEGGKRQAANPYYTPHPGYPSQATRI